MSQTKVITDRALRSRDLIGLTPGDTLVFGARSAASFEAARQTAYRARRVMNQGTTEITVSSDFINQTITVTRKP